jgi:hypothetical protein
MPSEYDPLFHSEPRPESGDLESVRDLFEAASRPFLRSPWSWFAWAAILPAAALATPAAFRAGGPTWVLFTWSGAILLGGLFEFLAIRRSGPGATGTPLASWALRVQGNLSLVALALSALLLWIDQPWALPGVWLLLLGHSFYALGGLAFPAFRGYGILYQLGGVVALWPDGAPLLAFAAAAALGNVWMGVAVFRERRGRQG